MATRAADGATDTQGIQDKESTVTEGAAMKINQEMLEGRWNEIKGKVRERWGQISEQDLQTARGNTEQLVGVIQQKTGEGRKEVEEYLESLTEEGNAMFNRAAGAIQGVADRAYQTAQDATRQTAESLRSGYEQTERLVRERPIESLAVCFGTGLLTGFLLGLSLRSR